MFFRRKKTVEGLLAPTFKIAVQAGDWSLVEKLCVHFKALSQEQRIADFAVYVCLFSTEEGYKLFLNDPAWINLITVDELNTPDQHGDTLLRLIARHINGRRLIDENSMFRKKILEQSFGRVDKDDRSPAHYFLRFADGRRILQRHAELRAGLSEESLNKFHVGSGMPTIYGLAKSAEGMAILSDPVVLDRIDSRSLNVINVFYSVVYFVTSSDAGIALLDNTRFRHKIRSRALNARDDFDNNSAVIHLCRSVLGRGMLARYEDLRTKIQADTFNARMRNNASALYYLVRSPEGISLLANCSDLRHLITAEGLNATITDGPDKDVSPLSLLMASKEGRNILHDDKRLWELADPRRLAVAKVVQMPTHDADGQSRRCMRM